MRFAAGNARFVSVWPMTHQQDRQSRVNPRMRDRRGVAGQAASVHPTARRARATSHALGRTAALPPRGHCTGGATSKRLGSVRAWAGVTRNGLSHTNEGGRGHPWGADRFLDHGTPPPRDEPYHSPVSLTPTTPGRVSQHGGNGGPNGPTGLSPCGDSPLRVFPRVNRGSYPHA